jgi:hypothetical protein
LARECFKRFSVDVLGDLLPDQAAEMIERLRARAPQPEAPPAVAQANGHAAHDAPAAPPATPPNGKPAAPVTPDQLQRFTAYRNHCIDAGMEADEWQDIFHRRGVRGPADLTEQQAEELLGKLRAQLELQDMHEGIHGKGGEGEPAEHAAAS